MEWKCLSCGTETAGIIQDGATVVVCGHCYANRPR